MVQYIELLYYIFMLNLNYSNADCISTYIFDWKAVDCVIVQMEKAALHLFSTCVTLKCHIGKGNKYNENNMNMNSAPS